MRTSLSIALLLAFAAPAFAQDNLVARLKAVEDNNKAISDQLNARFDKVELRLDKIEALLANKKTEPVAMAQATPTIVPDGYRLVPIQQAFYQYAADTSGSCSGASAGSGSGCGSSSGGRGFIGRLFGRR
jgi:hypothetical protein